MIGLRSLKFGSKLFLILLFVGALSLLLASLVGYIVGKNSITEAVFSQLTSIGSARSSHLASHFQEMGARASLLVSHPTVQSAFDSFSGAARSIQYRVIPAEQRRRMENVLDSYYSQPELLNLQKRLHISVIKPPSDSVGQSLQYKYVAQKAFDLGAYDVAHARSHEALRLLCEQMGFYDLVLADASGRVLYTVRKEADFGVNLINSPRGGLSEAFRQAMEQRGRPRSLFVDFSHYAPSFGVPSAFVAFPLQKNGKRRGVLIAQISLKSIDTVMHGDKDSASTGLGETGETYLVGADFRMRSNSRFMLEDSRSFLASLTKARLPPLTLSAIRDQNTTLLLLSAQTPTVESALRGHLSEAIVKNYRGAQVLSSAQPVNIPGLNWVIVSEKDEAEALIPLQRFRVILMGVSIALLGVIGLISVRFARHVVEPIQKLADAAHAFGRGDLNARVEVKGNDEIAELGNTFNQMTQNAQQMETIAHSLRRNIVHDLKTPVTVIRGCAETLRMQGDDPDPELQQEMLNNIMEQSDLMMDDLRDLLSPVDEHWHPQPESFDLAQLISRVAIAESHTARAAHHQILLEGVDQPLWIRADRRKVRRVIENLLSNAIKYSPDADRVLIRLSPCPEDASVQMEFIDYGLGMTEEQLQTVLSVGGRVVDHSLNIEGTGFGLSSCRYVLEAHGGALTATSTPGEGSQFTAILPLEYQGEVGEEEEFEEA